MLLILSTSNLSFMVNCLVACAERTVFIMGSLGPVATAPRRIELAGTPREIGLEHGRQLAEEIRGQISVYEAMFKQTSKLDWAAVKDVSKDYAATIKALTPDVYTEMEGIADGAELDVLDIVALNARSEIALGLFSDGCSSLGWKREDEVLLAQNWDWTARVKDNCCLMSIKQENKPAIWMVTEVSRCPLVPVFLTLSTGRYRRKDRLQLGRCWDLPECDSSQACRSEEAAYPHRLASLSRQQVQGRGHSKDGRPWRHRLRSAHTNRRHRGPYQLGGITQG